MGTITGKIWSPTFLTRKHIDSQKIATPRRYPQVILTYFLISLLCNVPRKLHLQVDSVRSFGMAGNAVIAEGYAIRGRQLWKKCGSLRDSEHVKGV